MQRISPARNPSRPCPPLHSSSRLLPQEEDELRHGHSFARNGEKLRRLRTFSSLLRKDLAPAGVVFHAALHSAQELSEHRFLRNLLLQAYGKALLLPEAAWVFGSIHRKNVFSWNIFLAALVRSKEHGSALQQFQQMMAEGICGDEFTYSTIIDACAETLALAEAMCKHACVVGTPSESHAVIATGLMKVYSEHGLLAQAKEAFDRVRSPDTILWSAAIDAFAKHGFEKISVELFAKMQGQQRIGSRPDPVTLLSILGACATLSASMLGRLIHSAIIDANCESELSIANALLNMYAKCGDSDDGLCVFNKMPARDVISWTAMISAYAQVGLVEDSIRLFAAMQDSGICPNEITYVNVLSACSHEGKVEEGFHCFVSVFGGRGSMMMMPTSQHYGCLVDLYARAGRLEEAEIILRNSEVRSNAVIWQTLLGACRFHDDVDRGKRAAEHVIMLDPSISASYVALSDFYALET